MLKKILQEPLVHFLALAVAVFIAYGVVNRRSIAEPDRIVVIQARIEQTAILFARTWRRPPTPIELKGLVDDYVKEEIYYREALALGLDANDTLIRRRLRQKMEFLDDAAIDAPTPTDTDLVQYLKANPAKFAIEPALAFRQIYLNPERRGEKIDQDAAAILEALRSDPSLDPGSLGDATLLPAELEKTSKLSISQTFGGEFAEAISQATTGQWVGPIKSGFGLHLVRITEMTPGRQPALSDVRDAVAREWTNEQRKTLADDRFAALLKRYQVTIEEQPKDPAQATARP